MLSRLAALRCLQSCVLRHVRSFATLSGDAYSIDTNKHLKHFRDYHAIQVDVQGTTSPLWQILYCTMSGSSTHHMEQSVLYVSRLSTFGGGNRRDPLWKPRRRRRPLDGPHQSSIMVPSSPDDAEKGTCTLFNC